MLFAHDTEVALVAAAALVNTDLNGVDALAEPDGRQGLDDFLRAYPYTGLIAGDGAELSAVRALRDRLRAVWSAAESSAESPGGEAVTAAVGIVNALLADAGAQPYLTRHDEWDWHLHVTEPDAPLVERIGAEAAMGFVDLIRSNELSRLRHCAADDCDAVLVDFSRNSSRRYCDTGNCGNRANVAAYRARKAARTEPGIGTGRPDDPSRAGRLDPDE
ncbi:CGNR zinc finger domain-containing protein [Jatrophihabitans sp. DSM 45814]